VRPRLQLAAAIAPVPLIVASVASAADRTPLPAAIRDSKAPAARVASGGGSGAFVRMIVGLAVVLAVIYGVYWLLKTYGKSKRSVQSDGAIDVVATTVLAQDRSVHLVRLGDELLLLGSAEHAITPLRVYKPEQARRITTHIEADGGPLRPLGPDGGGRQAPFARIVDELRRRTAR
jgi:flagellar protein FliO/FliZ